MCGIVGIYSHEPIAQSLYDSLIHLQHRGQDAAGILTCNNRFFTKHGQGLVREIFSQQDIEALHGHLGIAHTRYPTAGGYNASDVQPLWIGSPRGIALAHNGNLVNATEIAERMRKQHRHLNSSLDSEVLLHLFADYLAANAIADANDAVFFANLCTAIQKIYQEVEGSYSVVSIVIGKGLVAFRDPHGIRPLAFGKRTNADGTTDYIFASETTSFYALGFEPQGDLHAGELAWVGLDGKLWRKILHAKEFRPCVFEYVYFARPDATIDGVNVYRSRARMGENLAKAWQAKYPDLLPDVVIPAPYTANTAALAFAQTLGVRYSEGLYKNPFIGRTFIMANQKTRTKNVRYKLTPQQIEIKNKAVLIVDDSIVRGTTSREIVKMVKEAGAHTVYFASSSPPIKHPCVYGIDVPSRKELIASQLDEAAIKTFLGVDFLLYQKEEDLVEAVTRRGEHVIQNPCMACMNGNYICGNMTELKLKRLEQTRQAEQKKS